MSRGRARLGIGAALLLCATACRSSSAQAEAERDTDADARMVDVVDDNDAKLEEVAQISAQPPAQPGLTHFSGITNESVSAFCERAEQRIAALELEQRALASRAATDTEAADDLADARASLAEARDDLDDVRQLASGTVFDDGRLGVSFAINRAQRRLSAARDALPNPTI